MTGHDANAGRYEIRLQGHLQCRWAARFDGMTLSNEADGTTRMRGRVIDQAALHGILRALQDLGMPLLSVRRIEPDQPVATPDNR